MALKKKQTERVRVKSTATGNVVGVSKETADMMLRNKGEFELVKETAKAPAKPATKTAAKAPAKPAEESAPAGNE